MALFGWIKQKKSVQISVDNLAGCFDEYHKQFSARKQKGLLFDKYSCTIESHKKTKHSDKYIKICMDDNLSDEQFKAVFDDLKSIFGNPQYVYDMTCFEWKADEHYVRFGRIAVRYGLELPMIILTKESGDKKIEYTFYQQVADAFLKAKVIKYDCLLTWVYEFGFTHINIDGNYVYHVDFCGDCISAKKTRLPTEQEKQEMFSADNVEKRKELNKKLVVFDKKEYTSVDKLAQVLCDMIEN